MSDRALALGEIGLRYPEVNVTTDVDAMLITTSKLASLPLGGRVAGLERGMSETREARFTHTGP